MKTSCLGGRTANGFWPWFYFPHRCWRSPCRSSVSSSSPCVTPPARAIATADEQGAAASYRELRNNYIPQFSTGAGLGSSYGFPLALEGSAPSLFNINTQSALLNPALLDFIHAAKAESAVASLKTKDRAQPDHSGCSPQLRRTGEMGAALNTLQDTETAANQMQAAVAERVKEGVDSEIEGTKARLSAARVRLRIAEAQGAADVLREHLSKLTGMPAANIQTDPDSIPAPPGPPPVRRRRKILLHPLPQSKRPSSMRAHNI